MLSRGYRLAGQRDLQTLLRTGKRFTDGSTDLFVRRNRLPHSRFGCGLRSGVYRRAVDRNRWKRVMRAVIRRQWDRMLPGFDLFAIARSPAVPCSVSTCEAPVLALLKQAGVLL
jgi:ribonuclease P protein component